MTADQTTTALVARLLALCERFGTRADNTGQRHLDNREQMSHLGVCTQRRSWMPSVEVVPDGTGFRPAHHTLTGTCADSCLAWQAAVNEARAYVAAHEVVQLDLMRGVA